MKTSSDEDKKMWEDVLVMDLMSSEESAVDDETGEDVLIIHPLPWQSNHYNKFIDELTEECQSEKSPQALRQAKKRIVGCESKRAQPKDKNIPQWCLN